VSVTSIVQRHRSGGVQEDWVAWLPDETGRVFEQLRQELAASCVILGVILNEALSGSPDETLVTAAPLALLFTGIFDRLVASLCIVLSALEEHERAHGTRPHARPLLPAYFRTRRARYLARANRLRSCLPIIKRSDFGPKLSAIRQVIAGLQHQARQEAWEIAAATESKCARARWARLEILQYDLNTCLQETTVVLKSFFCALPGHELPRFRSRLPV
jgi:hypothetical protein